MSDVPNPSSREKVKELFARAIDLPPEQRAAMLDEACAGDLDLRAAVESLLEAQEHAGEFMAGPTLPGSAVLPPQTQRQIGPYKLLQVIGEGGFGTVYMAEQETPVRRRVALKIIKLGMDTRQVVARFEAERQALAMMEHPNIAKVFDAGATESGRPYFVMELVKGVPITDYCDHENLSIEQRLELFAQVCQAVQHAHQKGLIHRDIKPSNILVSRQDDRAVIKVIDFGIAKATQARLTEKTLFTEFQQLVGTPEYMSPEQAEGSLDIDTRTDVYALGVLLYELLTGTTPFDARDLRSKAYAEMQRVIREVDPPKPSTRLSAMKETISSVAARRHVEPRKLSMLIRGELDWIVMKALEKDRSRRYDSASSLAGDILHHLADEPVTAGAPSRIHRLQKFIRRHRGPVAASAALVIVLVAGVIGTTIGLIGQARQRAIAEQQRAEAQTQAQEATRQAAIAGAVSQFQSDMLESADPNRMLGDKVTVLQAVMAAIEELDAGKLKDQPLVEASVRDMIGNTLRALGRYDAAEPVLRKALELQRVHLPSGSADLGRGTDSLAKLYFEQARYNEAEPLFRESLTITRSFRSGPHRDTAVSLSNLAVLLGRQGKLAESESLLREAVEMYRKVLPPGDWQIGSGLNNLALALHQQGRYAEAEQLYRESVQIRRTAFPPGHPRIADGVGNLAEVLREQGKLGEAETLHRETLQIRRSALPATHPDIALNLRNLALVLQAQGKAAEAQPLVREALSIRRAALPADHPDIAQSLGDAAVAALNQGNAAEAERFFRESLMIYRKTLPAVHSLIAINLSNLSVTLQRQGKLSEAEPLAREALDMQQRSLPAGHPHIADAQGDLATLLYAQGKFHDAESLYREALAAEERALGADNWQAGHTRMGLGRTLAALHRPVEAEEALLAAYQILSPAQGAYAKSRDKAVQVLGELYETWDKSEPGKGYAAKAQQWKSRAATRPATQPGQPP